MKKFYSKILFNLLIIIGSTKILFSGNAKARSMVKHSQGQFIGDIAFPVENSAIDMHRTEGLSVSSGTGVPENIATGVIFLILSPILLISLVILGTYSFYKITKRKLDNQDLYLADGILGLILFLLSYSNIQKIQETANIKNFTQVFNTILEDKILMILVCINMILAVWFTGFLLYIIFSAFSNRKLTKIEAKK